MSSLTSLIFVICPYPYSLNTKLNLLDSKDINNVYQIFGTFGNKREIKRGHRGSHRFSNFINDVIPPLWLKNHEKFFVEKLNVKCIKTTIFNLILKTAKKVYKYSREIKTYNKQFTNLINDLLQYRLLVHTMDAKKENIYFVLDFQQKYASK